MAEEVLFTEEDLAEMAAMALDKRDLMADVPHAHRMRRPGRDVVDGYIDGYRGEWAVADSLGLDRPRQVNSYADPGYDLIAPNGETINVRYRNHPLGRLMALTSKPITADAAVLVVPTADPYRVRIVGAVNAPYLMKRGNLENFGFGWTRWLPQHKLVPWERWKPRLLAAAA